MQIRDLEKKEGNKKVETCVKMQCIVLLICLGLIYLKCCSAPYSDEHNFLQ